MAASGELELFSLLTVVVVAVFGAMGLVYYDINYGKRANVPNGDTELGKEIRYAIQACEQFHMVECRYFVEPFTD